MTTLEQAARQALEALENIERWLPTVGQKGLRDYEADAITALRQALEQPTVKDSLKVEKEPTLYQYRTRANWEGALGWSAWENCTKAHAQDYLNCPLVHDWLYEVRALYTEPPKREWVGLSDEEIEQGLKETWVTIRAWQSAVWWAEAKLKELNA